MSTTPIPIPQGATIDDAPQAVPIPAGASVEGDQSQPEQPQQGGIPGASGAIIRGLEKASPYVQDFAAGVGKGAMQTANSVSGLLNKIPGIGETLAPSEGVNAAEQIATPTNTAQKVGVGAESLAEFLLGDEALKSLSLGDKLLKIGKVAETYEQASPFAKAAIEHALTMARQSAVGAVTGAAKDGAEGAEEGAIGGALAEPVGVVAGKAVGAAGKVLKGAAETASDLWATATGKALQKGLQDGILSTATKVADDAGVEVAEPAIRDTFESIADGVQGKSKALYDQIDEATGGQFTNLQDKIRNVETKLRTITGTDDAAEEKLFSQQIALKAKLDEEMEQLISKNVDPSIADDARTAWRQQSALRDLDAAIKGATEGNVTNAPEVVDPKKLVSRLQKLDDSGRLAEAVGEDRANEILQQAYDSKKAVASRATTVKVTKAVAKGGAIAAGAGYGLERVLGGQ